MAFGITKVGLLGEATNTTTGTHTVYTVPAGSTARGRLMWGYEGGSATQRFRILVNGHAVFGTAVSGVGGGDSWSGFRSDASGNIYDTDQARAYAELAGEISMTAWASSAQHGAIAELPADYYLNAGDTVQYQIGNIAAQDCYVAFQGTEFTV